MQPRPAAASRKQEAAVIFTKFRGYFFINTGESALAIHPRLLYNHTEKSERGQCHDDVEELRRRLFCFSCLTGRCAGIFLRKRREHLP